MKNFINNSIQNILNIGYNNKYQIVAAVVLPKLGLKWSIVAIILLFL